MKPLALLVLASVLALASSLVLAQAPGSFSIADIAPGKYVLTAEPPAGLRLRSALVDGGDDLADVPLLVRPGRQLQVVVTLTDRGGELAGTLTTPEGRAATSYAVLVMTAQSSLWLPGARRVRAVRPATDGQFAVRDLPTDDYFIAAVTDFEDDDLDDPAFLAEASRQAIRVSVGEGRTTVQNIRIAQ